MRLKLLFSKNDIPVPLSTQSNVNSFIHANLGTDNKYHDSFSDYSISTLQGGYRRSQDIDYPKGGYVFVTTNNMDFINSLTVGLYNGNKTHLGWGMEYKGMDIIGLDINKKYDIVFTISPILLKDHQTKRLITVKDDIFVDKLKDNCLKKLSRYFTPNQLRTFDITLFKGERSKTVNVIVKDIINQCSVVKLVVNGSPKVRETLYGLGLGNSTGCGFGAVKVYK